MVADGIAVIAVAKEWCFLGQAKMPDVGEVGARV
jgi:hypothetical protein